MRYMRRYLLFSSLISFTLIKIESLRILNSTLLSIEKANQNGFLFEFCIDYEIFSRMIFHLKNLPIPIRVGTDESTYSYYTELRIKKILNVSCNER